MASGYLLIYQRHVCFTLENMHVRSGSSLVLHPLLAMNAPRQSVAREVTSIVTFVSKNIPDQLLFLDWCRSVGDILGLRGSAVQMGWQKIGHCVRTSI